MSSKDQEIKICVFLYLLDKMINGTETRFNQETLIMTNRIGHLMELKINQDNVVNL